MDHGEDLDYLEKALELGFTSVMYDGSLLSYEENVANTQKAVALAAKYGADYEFYHNMLIEIDSEPHELDLVFRVGDKIFWGEIKTGDDFNPDEYRKRGIRMGFIPDRLIILSAKDNYETTASIAHFNDCFCGNVNSFKNELTKMIDKAFREELK